MARIIIIGADIHHTARYIGHQVQFLDANRDTVAEMLKRKLNCAEVCVWSKAESKQFHVMNHLQFCSMFLPDNDRILQQIPNLASIPQLLRTVRVQTKTLDDIVTFEYDQLVLACNGSELPVLQGATKLPYLITLEHNFRRYAHGPRIAEVKSYLQWRGYALLNETDYREGVKELLFIRTGDDKGKEMIAPVAETPPADAAVLDAEG